MSRLLRVLLVAAVVAAPAVAPKASQGPDRDWAVTASASLAGTLTAVVDPPVLPELAAPEWGHRWVMGAGGGCVVQGAPSFVPARGDVESHRPRIVRRRRPAPAGADGEPPL